MTHHVVDAFLSYTSARATTESEWQRGLAETLQGGSQGPLVLLGHEGSEELLHELAGVARGALGPEMCNVRLCVGALALASESAKFDKSTTVVYCRRHDEAREDVAIAASAHEFEVLPGQRELLHLDFARLVGVLRCAPAEPCLGPGTYYVSLTFADMSEAMDKGDEWTPPAWAVKDKGAGPLHSALEVRVDLLRSLDEAFVLSQLALVRRRSSGLPIIYTVRTRLQGGSFPDDEGAVWRMMLLACRFGVEYIDVEAGLSREGRAGFMSLVKFVTPGCRVIGSYHAVQRPLSALSDSELAALFHECAYGPTGSVDIVKVVARAGSAQCSIRVNQVALGVRAALPSSVRSVIAICTTDAGRLSRALNVMLGPTPVSHPALPGIAAPGQLSAVEIEGIRRTLGLPATVATSRRVRASSRSRSPRKGNSPTRD